jgi:hypothetical protein
MMNKTTKSILTLAAFCALPVAQSSAALVWTGAADTDLFNEANWLDDNGAIPAADTINPSTNITAVTGGEIQITTGISPATFTAVTGGLIQIDSGPLPATFTAGNFQPGPGNNLTIGGGLSFTGQLSNRGLTYGNSGPIGGNVSVIGGSTVELRFMTRAAISLDGGSTITLEGGTPLNTSTVNFLDTASVFNFNNATFANLLSAGQPELSQFTFQGAALVFGADPFAVEPGDNALATAFNGTDGVSLSAVPEPTSAILVSLLGSIGLLRRRR